MDWTIIGSIGQMIGAVAGGLITLYFFIRSDRKKTVEKLLTDANLDLTQRTELEDKIKKVADETDKKFAERDEKILTLQLGFSSYNGTVKQAINNVKELFNVKLESIEKTVNKTQDLIIKHIEGK